jgi:hypothetical protein
VAVPSDTTDSASARTASKTASISLSLASWRRLSAMIRSKIDPGATPRAA